MIRTFEILAHTADTGFRVSGATCAELAASAGFALAETIFDTSAVRPTQSYPVRAHGTTFPETLVNWLNEVLFLIDARHVALRDFDVVLASGDEIHATAAGEPRDDSRHPPRVVVKAVTFHQLDVRETPQGWFADIYLDI